MTPRQLVLAQVDWRTWERQVSAYARRGGWLEFSNGDSRRAVPGWPDKFLVRGERIIAAELKCQGGRVRPAQRLWLAALAATGKVECYTWYPQDADAIEALLCTDARLRQSR